VRDFLIVVNGGEDVVHHEILHDRLGTFARYTNQFLHRTSSTLWKYIVAPPHQFVFVLDGEDGRDGGRHVHRLQVALVRIEVLGPGFDQIAFRLVLPKDPNLLLQDKQEERIISTRTCSEAQRTCSACFFRKAMAESKSSSWFEPSLFRFQTWMGPEESRSKPLKSFKGSKILPVTGARRDTLVARPAVHVATFLDGGQGTHRGLINQ
jgi:hypothetical protein